MKILITADRIRSVIAGTSSEKDLIHSLRRHRIRFYRDDSNGFPSLRVPLRSGSVLIYRACSRSAPFVVAPLRSSCFAPFN